MIELFASQNCQACPKAHRTLQSVAADNQDVLILTWSVDYWDYLGEADPMATPEAKARQAAYAERMSLRAPYTPQSVYDGVKQCPATRRRTVDSHIEARRSAAGASKPSFQQNENMVSVPNGCETPLDVLLIEYLPTEAHETGMVNPVTSLRSLGACTKEQKQFEFSCLQSCAVVLQEPGYGEVKSALVLQ
ncbi:MAG: thioredoxin family protein [Henriciella sp.]